MYNFIHMIFPLNTYQTGRFLNITGTNIFIVLRTRKNYFYISYIHVYKMHREFNIKAYFKSEIF